MWALDSCELPSSSSFKLLHLGMEKFSCWFILTILVSTIILVYCCLRNYMTKCFLSPLKCCSVRADSSLISQIWNCSSFLWPHQREFVDSRANSKIVNLRKLHCIVVKKTFARGRKNYHHLTASVQHCSDLPLSSKTKCLSNSRKRTPIPPAFHIVPRWCNSDHRSRQQIKFIPSLSLLDRDTFYDLRHLLRQCSLSAVDVDELIVERHAEQWQQPCSILGNFMEAWNLAATNGDFLHTKKVRREKLQD